MQEFEIVAEPRTDVGKGASRRLRRSGKLPGIIYGVDKEAMSISLDHNQLKHQLESESFYSHVLTLKIGKDEFRAVLKDLQRHPFKPNILHVDFLRVSESEEITMRVPIHYINEEQCIGVKQEGGVISHIMTEVELTCLPKDLPEYIEVDMLNLQIGDAVHLSDLKLPEGVEIYALTHGGDPDQPIASVQIQRVVEEEVEEAEEGAEAVEGEVEGEKHAETGGEEED